jgi:hypothetical protein
MNINIKLGAVGVFLTGMGILASACVAETEPAGTSEPEPLGETEQASEVCSSDCTGVEDGIPFSETCSGTCTASHTSITCNGVTTECKSSCSPLSGKTCGTLKCECMTITETYDCAGVCVHQACSCCGKLPC